MDNETEKRIAHLEREVRALRLELNELKGINQVVPQPVKKDLPQLKEELENPLVKLNKAAAQSKTPQPVKQPSTPPTPNQEAKQQNPRAQRSFEERVMWALPKVFMVILVLGVLWGLKLISDYGLFSNTIKILLAYALSISLIGIALAMDKRKKDISQVLTVVLYGGAFIIGILTTAAGAILYDVLSLSIALLLALLYIAYGIAISFLKKNEVLSVFVIFTSLLLPYLLEYMDFNGVVIVLYVVLVYGVMQLVFIKHVQKVANYIAYFFSISAVQVIWGLNHQDDHLYVYAHVLLNVILLFSWFRLYDQTNKLKTFHEGLLFSLSGLTIFMMNAISDEIELPLLVFMLIFGSVAYLTYKQQLSRIVDVVGTIAFLTLFNVLMVIRFIPDDIDQLLLPFSAFIGIMLGIRLGAMLMKISYSILFTLIIFLQLIVNDVEPFWRIEHLTYVLIFIYLVSIWTYVRRKTVDKVAMKLSFINDFFPIVIVLYFFIYIIKLDYAYVSSAQYPYVAILLLSIVMLVSFFTPERYIGQLLRYALIFAFTLITINLLPVHTVFGFDRWMNLFVRLVYAAIIIAILADIVMEGRLYEKWIRHLKLNIDGLMTVGIVATMVVLYAFLTQLEYDYLFDHLMTVASKTILLFATASISLWLSTLRNYRIVRTLGYIVLAIAIFKLIFFDLASLNLLIRAVLFMSIGGIGLFLSNRLLKNASNIDKNE
ncbi:DUF2339 domain-containing protein [Lysinibacillus antri]|uniref:DUF2339 domain-containing protein n=1 Tax=Lysinibacillus antri TaxID=2498145 RepID=A0A3S0PPM2_9BACI|nr:DUF2339 domain-containing protein [Lysinibacillus antri]RUL52203.1 DUF2339 domain-containing protein [Lysinibacillus antri]